MWVMISKIFATHGSESTPHYSANGFPHLNSCYVANNWIVKPVVWLFLPWPPAIRWAIADGLLSHIILILGVINDCKLGHFWVITSECLNIDLRVVCLWVLISIPEHHSLFSVQSNFISDPGLFQSTLDEDKLLLRVFVLLVWEPSFAKTKSISS